MIAATVDVGTNTALLLVAEVGPEGIGRVLHDEQRFVRLGEGVDATGQISQASIRRLVGALRDYADTAAHMGSREVIVTGTSAARDAANRGALERAVREETGLTIEILSGDEEARWTFAGAVSAFDDFVGPVAVVDVGGGSTEYVVGEVRQARRGEVDFRLRRSMDVGGVRLTERMVSVLPPSRNELEALDAHLRTSIEGAEIPSTPSWPFIGAAGTASSLALVHAGVHAWEETRAASVTLTRAEMAYWRRHLCTLSYDEVLALNPPVLTGRADVFPVGVLILEYLFRRSGAEVCRISPRGLRHGVALRLAGRDA